MSRKNGFALFFVTWFVAAALAGCGGGGGGGGTAPSAANPTTSGTTVSQGGTATRGTVSVVLDYSNAKSRALRATKAMPAATATVLVCLRDPNSGQDCVTPASSGRPSGSTQTVLISDVTPGTYQALIKFLDAAGNIIGYYCAPVVVQAGQATTLTVTDTNSPSTVTVSPSAPSIAVGTSQAFSATAVYADGSSLKVTGDATWTSSAPAVATIDTTGLAQGLTGGPSTITATFSGTSGSTTLTVKSKTVTVTAISITPKTPTIGNGGKQPFTAMGTLSDGSTQDMTSTVAWDSSDKTIATISTAGLATSLAMGVTTISATFNAASDSTTLTVGPATVTALAVAPLATHVLAGKSTSFTLKATYTDGSQAAVLPTDATWQSSDVGLATVSAGNAQGLRPGLVTITATYQGTPGAATLTVDWDPTTWTVRQNREFLNKVASDGAGHFVAVGNLGTVSTSPDGTTWKAAVSGTKSDLMGVCFGANAFVAVGWDGTVITSTDSGATWTAASAGVPLAAVAFGAVGPNPGQNLFVAVGLDQVLTSPDGATWTALTTGFPATTNLISAAVDSAGAVYVVGQDTVTGTAAIWSSADGTTWTQPAVPSLPVASQLTGIACGSLNGNAYVVAVGWYTDQVTNLNQALLVHSVNGAWTQDASPIISPNLYNMEVAFAGSRFVAVGDSSYLFDGTTWTSSGTPLGLSGNAANGWPSVAWDAFLNRLVGVGAAGHITTSTDGTTWTMLTTGSSVDLAGLAYGQGQWVAVGAATILTSLDGFTWAADTFPGAGLFNPTGVTYGKTATADAFVAIGYDQGSNTASILTKANGSTWTAATGVPNVPALSAVTSGKTQFVAVGTNVIVTSPDGLVWTQPAVTIPATTYLTGIATDGDHFVAIGDDNGSPVVYTSPDGATWTLVTLSTVTPAPQVLSTVTFGNGKFVAGGYDATFTPQIVTSSDLGATWTPVVQALTAQPEAITFGDGHFVATAWSTVAGVNNKVILDSTDGVSWTTYDLATENDLPAIACGNGQFVTVGRNGEILSNP